MEGYYTFPALQTFHLSINLPTNKPITQTEYLGIVECGAV